MAIIKIDSRVSSYSGQPARVLDLCDTDNGFGVGYIDEVRIVRDSAVYTSNFTPPTTEY